MNIVCFAHSERLTGGANRSLLSVVEGLKEKGNQVTVVLPGRDAELERCYAQLDVPVVVMKYYKMASVLLHDRNPVIRYLKLFIKFAIDLFRSRRYAARIAALCPDVCYTNTRLPYMGALVAKRLDIPHVWHMREYSIDNGSVGLPFENHIFDCLSEKVICISQDLLSEFNKGISSQKLVCIYNGIPNTIVPVMPKAHRGINILLTGRIIQAKDHMEALKALKLLLKNYNEITLYFAGSALGEEGKRYEKDLNEYISKNRLSDYVVYLGEVKDMAGIRALMDIEIVCSKREAFGRVTIEAMRCGLPVVGANTGATPELIEDGVSGLLYPKGDEQALADMIERLALDEPYRLAMGKAAFAAVKNRFTVAQNVDEIWDILRSVV